MAQTGILDYKRYLNTLQTLTNLGQTFPSSQQTYNFSVAGGGTASWPATISWETLILDKVAFSSQATGYIPDVSNSEVVGYYEGSTATQYSSGVISIPANMYTGPILPGGDYNVPLTVVHIEWFDGTTTYAQQIGFIQQWEPGVPIGDPANDFDFAALYGIPSNLTLTGIPGLIYGDDLVLIATTDMAIDLGTNTRVRFYQRAIGGDILLGTANFVGRTATFNLTTIGNFPIGEYNFYAVSSAVKIYLKATSNDFNVRVAAGVPLIVNTSTFDPNKAYYFPGDNVTYNLGVYADPAFTATGVAISNTLTVTLINGFPPNTQSVIGVTNFVNGQAQIPFTVDASMIDSARVYPQTQYSITQQQIDTVNGIYTATLLVRNTETVTSVWNSQFIGRYAGGTTSTSIQVATTTSVTVVADAFPITITQDSTNTFVSEEFIITVNTPNVAYYNTLTIFAQKGASLEAIYTGNNSGTGQFTASVFISSSTGTWTLFASYPGDLGLSLINANSSSTSNSLSHFIRNGNELLPPPILNFYRTPDNDILEVRASTSTTLTNIVSFYEGTTLLGTAEWVRNSGTFFYASGPTITHRTSGFARNFQPPPVVQTIDSDGPRGGSGTGPAYVLNPLLSRYVYSPNRPLRWISVSENKNALLDQDITTGVYSTDQRYNVFTTIFTGLESAGTYYNSKLTGIGWASPISSTSTNYNSNHWGLNPNMQKFNDLEGGGPYGKFPNRYTLFKYYDGENYAINTGSITDIYDIADPIEFGTVWRFNSSEVGGPIRFRPFKSDKIGDARGYNVIALEASGYRPLSDGPEGHTEILRFDPLSINTQTDITLVEFLGTATWAGPSLDVLAGNPIRPQTQITQITAWLYRFTPEIPQANVDFQTQYPYQEALELTRQFNNIDIPGNAPGLDRGFSNYCWQRYAKKQFPSQVGQAFFNAVTNPVGTAIYSQTGEYGPSHTQTAVLILPRNSISTVTNVHAVWTGTQNLNVIYGKYYGFDIYVTAAPTKTSLQIYNLTTNSQLLNVATSISRDTNAVRLVANVDFGSTLNPDSEITGNVIFYEQGTNYQFGIATVTNKVATLDIYGNQLYATGRPPNPYAPGATLTVGTKSVLVRAEFTSTNFDLVNSASTSRSILSTYDLGDTYQAYNGSPLVFEVEKSFGLDLGPNPPPLRYRGTLRFVIPWFAKTQSSGVEAGVGSIFFTFTYSINTGSGWSTYEPLPMNPSTWNLYGRFTPLATNQFKVDRNNYHDPDPFYRVPINMSFGVFNLSVPFSGFSQVRVRVDVTTSNASIPTKAQLGLHDFTVLDHRS
jgi:hypothetical protein